MYEFEDKYPDHVFFPDIRVGILRNLEDDLKITISGYTLTDKDKKDPFNLQRGIAQIIFEPNNINSEAILQVPMLPGETVIYVKKGTEWRPLVTEIELNGRGRWVGYLEARIPTTDPPIAVG